ncbi:MAG: AEC family transporter [Proteobacteria bacterium]|nr:AEC family transporter [Pseudomonadota bacterium]
MIDIITAILPIFVIIAIGFALFRNGILPPEAVRALGAFVLTVALPALVFKSLARHSFAEIINTTYLLAFGLGTAGTALIVFCVGKLLLKRDITASAIMALGAAAGNSGFVGYPIAAILIGPPAVVALALSMLVENLLLLPIMLAVAEAGQGAGQPPGVIARSIFRSLLRNPLILAIIAGIAASLIGFRLPAPLEKSVDILAGASAAVALISIGGALAQLRLGHKFEGLPIVVFGKLVLNPALVLLAQLALPPLEPKLRLALIIIASAPMMTIYPLLGARFGQGSQAAAALMVATVLSFITMSGFIAFAG